VQRSRQFFSRGVPMIAGLICVKFLGLVSVSIIVHPSVANDDSSLELEHKNNDIGK
jgi:hypothetical protein